MITAGRGMLIWGFAGAALALFGLFAIRHLGETKDRGISSVPGPTGGSMWANVQDFRIMETNSAGNAKVIQREGLEKITKEEDLNALSSDELVAFIKLLGDPTAMDKRLLMMKAFEKLAALDGIVALNLAKSLPVETCKRVGWGIFGTLAITNPETVRSWVLSNDWTNENDRWLSIVGVVEFARLAPGDAAALLKQCDPARSERLRFPILVEMAKSDFGLAMQTAKAIGVDKQKDLLSGMLIALGRENPAKAYAECEKLGEQSIAEMVVPGILGKWIDKDTTAAFGVLAEVEPRLLQMVLTKTDDNGHSYISKLIEADGSLFVELLNRMVLTSTTKVIFNQAMTSLSDANFPLAEKLLAGMPDSPAKRDLTVSAFAALSDRDPDHALQEAGKLTGEERETALRGIAKQLADKNFEKALAVATGAEIPAQKAIFREIAQVAAYKKPDNAVRILKDPVISQKIGADFRQEMLNVTVATWAKQDLSAAKQWVSTLPVTDAAKGYQGLMTSWTKSDPVAASGWLTTQPVGPARDAGAQVLISQIKDTDPEMAEQWRKTLPPSAK